MNAELKERAQKEYLAWVNNQSGKTILDVFAHKLKVEDTMKEIQNELNVGLTQTELSDWRAGQLNGMAEALRIFNRNLSQLTQEEPK